MKQAAPSSCGDDGSQQVLSVAQQSRGRVVRHFVIAAAVESCWLLFLFWMTLR